jgi:hypothetical protein
MLKVWSPPSQEGLAEPMNPSDAERACVAVPVPRIPPAVDASSQRVSIAHGGMADCCDELSFKSLTSPAVDKLSRRFTQDGCGTAQTVGRILE